MTRDIGFAKRSVNEIAERSSSSESLEEEDEVDRIVMTLASEKIKNAVEA